MILDKKILNIIDQKNQTNINEALFGAKYISPFIKKLKHGSNILEIGSGPCILLSQLTLKYPKHNIFGVEPIGPGFDRFRDTLTTLKKKIRINLHKETYETLPQKKYDLIFLINVIEHIKNWEDLIVFVKKRLSLNGKCLILCPNYGFPYESHFGLPVICSKKITYYFFKSQIKRYESEKKSLGLWDSLNFIKYKEINKISKINNLQIKFHYEILCDLINRLDSDDEFKKRKKYIYIISKFLLKSKIIRLIKTSLFKNYYPYIFLELSHSK